MALIRSIATVGGFTMASRVLGFVRDILVASVLGAGPVADAFFVAFKFPNLFRRLFAEGAFNAAFVPLFARTLEGDGEDAARRFAEQALAVLLWSLLVLVTVMQIAMPWAMAVFAPGFLDEPEKFNLAVELTRITFPYLLFVSVVSLLAGVLNSVGKFAAAAAAPILLNLCLIAAVLGLTPYTPTPGHALAWGVAAAGAVQFVWLLVHSHRAGFHLRLVRPRLTGPVRTLLKRIVPGAVGAGIYQINLLVDTVIASLLPSGAISYLFYADRVNQLPLGVVGVAVGTALLPVLSRQLRAGEMVAAAYSQNRALEFSLLLTLPAAAALAVIADPIVRTLFQRGAFGEEAAVATAAALGVYALGIPAYVLVKALTPGFFAREDTATPVKVAGVAMVANLILNLALMGPLAHVGIALATVLSAWLNALTLTVILHRRGHLALDDRLKGRALRILAAALGMAALLWAMQRWLMPLLSGHEVGRIGGLLVLVAAGAVSYGALVLLLRAARPSDLRGLTRRP